MRYTIIVSRSKEERPMKLGAKVVKHRRIILIAALLLLIPSFIGYKTTRINYDMLTYLPSTMDTMKGQNVLMNEFGKGGFSIVVLEHMKSDDVTKLKADYSRIDGVDQVLNLEDVLDPSIPKSMLPFFQAEDGIRDGSP